MNSIPGWDSVTGAGWWSNFYFWAGIIALLSLGVFEVISHRYTERKDELVTEQQDEIQRLHDEEMVRLKLATAEAHERAAKAELDLYKHKQPRTPDAEKFAAALKGHPTGKVQILYEKDCSDCFWLAQFTSGWLTASNWEVTELDILKTRPGFANLPPAISARGRPWGITIIAKAIGDFNDNSPWSVIFQAMHTSLGGGGDTIITGTNDPDMPDGLVRIVVAPKT